MTIGSSVSWNLGYVGSKVVRCSTKSLIVGLFCRSFLSYHRPRGISISLVPMINTHVNYNLKVEGYSIMKLSTCLIRALSICKMNNTYLFAT